MYACTKLTYTKNAETEPPMFYFALINAYMVVPGGKTNFFETDGWMNEELSVA